MVTSITAEFILTDEQLASGWNGDYREAALSVVARLTAVIGDDDNDYEPQHLHVRAATLSPMRHVTVSPADL